MTTYTLPKKKKKRKKKNVLERICQSFNLNDYLTELE